MSEIIKITPSDEQQAIIDSKEDTMVVSNPGTGKTTTLALKVIDLLENGIKPEEILCITFTAKAKKEMFDVIYGMGQGKFPDSDLLKIRIHTFHGFAYDYLTEAGFISSEIIGNNFLRYSIFENLIENKAFNYEKKYIISDLMPKIENAIRYIKSFGVTQDKIDTVKSAALIEQNFTPTKSFSVEDVKLFLKFFVKAYKHYEESKDESIDYSDMLLTFIKKFQGDKFQYVLVDEMQDMNEIQAQIVEMISENLFLVGDAKQAIFGFQGGSIKNLLKFQKKMKKLMLSTNRRSTQQILDYSKHYFLDKTEYKKSFQGELEKFNGVSKGPIPKIFSTGAPFAKALSLIGENPGKKIGIITRTNAQIIDISKHLDNHGIQYTTTSSQSTTKDAKNEIITFIKGIISTDLKLKISAAFTPFSPYSLKETFEFSKEYKKDKKKNQTLDSWKINLTKEDLDQLFVNEIYPLCVSKGEEWFSTAISVKQQIDEYLTYETPTFDELFDYIAVGEESYTEKNKDVPITLTTAHKAKGKAFDVVIYIPSFKSQRTSFIDSITASILEANKIDTEGEIGEESLRVNFVAFTRAREKLFIIADEKNAKTFHHEKLSEIEVDALEEEEISTSTISTKLAEAYSLFVGGRYADSEKLLKSEETWLKEYIFSYFENIEQFSWSLVNKKPYDFLIEKIVNKPQSSSAMDFGNIVHKALDKIGKDQAKLEDYTEENEVKSIKNGLDALEKIKNDHPGFKLKETELTVKLPVKSMIDYNEEDTLMFSGKIDAVYEHDDGVILIDYKTSRGTNEVSDYKRQLAVYKKMYSINNDIAEEKIKTCVIFVSLRGGINSGKWEYSIEYGTRDVFATFEKHLKKVLEWKKNPGEFIKELVNQDTEGTLHETIKDKLSSAFN
ncbi:MAG: ATP-dependent helicase [Thaumarchaeota archaeon]|nr:ATP-dependent helicase [Nitrososphaerota archaeon]